MKSTLKIDTQGQQAIIKIIRPDDVINQDETDDYDVRDKLINDFLKNPFYKEGYDWFQRGSHYQFPDKKITLTIITPVQEDDLFDRFRLTLLNRLIPYNTLCKMQEPQKMDSQRTAFWKEDDAIKINEFFEWAKSLSYQRYNGCEDKE